MGEELSSKSKAWIAFSILIFILNLNSSLCSIFHCVWINAVVDEMDALRLTQDIMMNLVVPLTDMLTVLGFIYLVHSMAKSDLSHKLSRSETTNTVGTYEVLKILKKSGSYNSQKFVVYESSE